MKTSEAAFEFQEIKDDASFPSFGEDGVDSGGGIPDDVEPCDDEARCSRCEMPRVGWISDQAASASSVDPQSISAYASFR